MQDVLPLTPPSIKLQQHYHHDHHYLEHIEDHLVVDHHYYVRISDNHDCSLYVHRLPQDQWPQLHH